MEVHDSTDGDVLVLTPNGNLYSADEVLVIESRLGKALASQVSRVVLDCEAVGQVSSAATRVLLMAVRKLERAQRRLVLCALSPKVRDAFAVSGFDKDFTIVATRDEAMQRVRDAVGPSRQRKLRPSAPVAAVQAAPAPPAPAEVSAPAEARVTSMPTAAADVVPATDRPAPIPAPAPVVALDADGLAATLLSALGAPTGPSGTRDLPGAAHPEADTLAALVLGALAVGQGVRQSV